MGEFIAIGLGLFFCIIIGAGIARWKLGRQDLFDIGEGASQMIPPKRDRKKPQ